LILSERRPELPEFGEIESRDIPESFLGWDNYQQFSVNEQFSFPSGF